MRAAGGGQSAQAAGPRGCSKKQQQSILAQELGQAMESGTISPKGTNDVIRKDNEPAW